MWWYDLRDTILNRLAVWCIKHCHNWSTIFYTACSRLEPRDVECMAKSYLQSVEKGWDE